MGLKGNQSALHRDVVEGFVKPSTDVRLARHDTVDKGQGRIERRSICLSDDVQWLRDRHPRWSCIGSIVEVRSERHSGEVTSTECRYYLSSLSADAPRMASAIRGHWGLETPLHWTLDRSFGEGSVTYRQGQWRTEYRADTSCRYQCYQ